MGTRGTYGFRLDETDKLTYNGYDSYPDHLGSTMVKFVKEVSDEQLRKIATEMIMVSEDIPASPEQVEICKEYFDGAVGNRQITDWYSLLRNAQGEPMEYTKGLKYMVESNNFVADSLFCEFGYIFNLDEGVLEFYKGFNKNRNAEGRYASLRSGEYNGIVLLKKFTFEELRERDVEDVVQEMNRLCGSEDDE